MAWQEEADGVFRGGGVKGLALAGALMGFAAHNEKPIKRWVNCAGASAGAIIAAYLTVHGDDAVDGLHELLYGTNFKQFEDWVGGSEVLAIAAIMHTHGLCHGDEFERWFDGVVGGAKFGDVKTPDGQNSRLKVVAVDVTNRQLLILPDDLPRYRRPGEKETIDPDSFPISKAVRMSMSIPYFFEPMELVRDYVRCTHRGGTQLWEGELVDRLDFDAANVDSPDDLAECEEIHEQIATIVDGGTLSNFPVWIFDSATEPKRLTFGFTLRGGKGIGGLGHFEHAPWLAKFALDIFHSAQDAWDKRFVSQSTRVRTVTVNAGNIATTQFDLRKEQKDMLVANGEAAASWFLDHFDPTKYRNTNGLAPSFVAEPAPEPVGAP